MKTYLVVGIYADNHQPFAQDFAADTPSEAATKAKTMAGEIGTELWVAGVYAVHPGDLDAFERNDFARLKNVA